MEVAVEAATLSLMDDSKPRRAPAAWIEALERGEADAAAGRVVDAEEFLRELEAEDEELERAQANRKRPSPAA